MDLRTPEPGLFSNTPAAFGAWVAAYAWAAWP